MTISARYENGVFKPLEDLIINEGTIVEVHGPLQFEKTTGKSHAIEGFGFFGMWKDRTDIGDSAEFLRLAR